MGRQGPGARGRPRQGRRRQACEVGGRGRAARQGDARHAARDAPERCRGLAGRLRVRRDRLEHRARAVLEPRRRPRTERIAVMASAAGGMDIEEVAHKTPEKILTLTLHPGGRLRGLPNPQARLRARLDRRAAGRAARHSAQAHEAVPRVRCEPPRDQSADRHEGRPRRRARRQDQRRGQRAVSAEAARRDARRRAGGRARAPRARARPELRLARRQHRVHGQRRRARDGDDGPDQAARRRAGELPRRRRRRHGRARHRGVQDHPHEQEREARSS